MKRDESATDEQIPTRQMAALKVEMEEVIRKHYPPKYDVVPDTMVFLYRAIVKDGVVIGLKRHCVPEWQANRAMEMLHEHSQSPST